WANGCNAHVICRPALRVLTMAERAIILIPDISGFTGFTGATEIDHAAHIITELLELIVASNETDFRLAEIEGDAVLFYRKGEPPRREQLVGQCLRMFANFHQRLKVIERDTVCQCGACQTASNLTLKFIAHFGYIKSLVKRIYGRLSAPVAFQVHDTTRF